MVCRISKAAIGAPKVQGLLFYWTPLKGIVDIDVDVDIRYR